MGKGQEEKKIKGWSMWMDERMKESNRKKRGEETGKEQGRYRKHGLVDQGIASSNHVTGV